MGTEGGESQKAQNESWRMREEIKEEKENHQQLWIYPVGVSALGRESLNNPN